MAVGILEVLLVNAKGLRNTDFLGKTDPYVIIKYKSQERQSSVARGQGSNPKWDEKVRFKVEYPGQGGDYKVTLRIMDHDNFSADDFLGEAEIYVKDLLALGVENGTAELKPLKYRVVGENATYFGEIQVGVTFTLKADDNNQEEYGGWRESNF
ncbi:hypothetical protein Tsubulata_033729 [Turnera subulata]|uniref:C2 domain-containing protein n=1 Tax=Turnera subulata TaxID=218843 RepID=A0A9Q0GH70_9ROSI|nr:hypothetical protein Tsubulata_033729 [Turnera subulata]